MAKQAVQIVWLVSLENSQFEHLSCLLFGKRDSYFVFVLRFLKFSSYQSYIKKHYNSICNLHQRTIYGDGTSITHLKVSTGVTRTNTRTIQSPNTNPVNNSHFIKMKCFTQKVLLHWQAQFFSGKSSELEVLIHIWMSNSQIRSGLLLASSSRTVQHLVPRLIKTYVNVGKQ